MRPLKILTWHVHGSYLYYLAQGPYEIYLPKKNPGAVGYWGRTPSYPWPETVHEIPAERVKNLEFDIILFQSRQNYVEDQYRILTEAQRRLPKIYLEHDPPREHPTDTRHVVDDPSVLLVHVTNFNCLMWDCGKTPTRVIDHGVMVPENVEYLGDFNRGLVVVNHIARRGRRLGYDLFQQVRKEIPLDLVGMGWDEAGGVGEIAHRDLPCFSARYRFFFNPIRYSSLGLSICEAMMTGLPILGLATTELVSVIENGKSGFLSTNPRDLTEAMRELLVERSLARKLGAGARRAALERFHIDRFVRDWSSAFQEVIAA